MLAAGRDIISFAPGYPAPDTFPWDELQRRSPPSCCGSRDGGVLQHGPTRGYRPLARRRSPSIMEHRGIATQARGSARHDRIAAGARSRRARAHRSRRRDPGRAADLRRRDLRVPQPCRRRSSACRRKPTGSISTRSTTPASALRRDGRRVKFLYVVPNFQNPTGLLIGLDKRQRLLEWAERRDVLIVEDDPYRELYFEDSATEADVRPIKADDRDGRVDLPEQLLEDARAGLPRRVDRGAAGAGGEVRDGQAGRRSADRIARPARRSTKPAAAACSSGSCRSCARTTRTSATSWSGRCGASSATSVSWPKPEGGFFLWLTLAARPRRRRDDSARGRARRDLRRRARRSTSNGEGQNTLRLSFSAPTPERIEAGVAAAGRLRSAPNRKHWRQRPQLQPRERRERLERRILQRPAASPSPTPAAAADRRGPASPSTRPIGSSARIRQKRHARHRGQLRERHDRRLVDRRDVRQQPLVRQRHR